VGVLESVAGGLLLAAIIGGWRWLRSDNRAQRIREAVCRHDWQPRDPDGILILAYDQQCRKCDAVRAAPSSDDF